MRAEVNNVKTERLIIPIRGMSPLVTHNWSEKAKRQMLEKQQGKSKPKEARDPQAEYQSAFYRIYREGEDEAYGMPLTAFKSATVSAARFYGKEVTMVGLRQSLYFVGTYSKAEGQPLIEIFGEPEMREDPVTIGQSGHEMRYRPQFFPWSATLEIEYVTSNFDRGLILSLVDAGGRFVGVGEWRPEKSGVLGTYEIDTAKGVQVI